MFDVGLTRQAVFETGERPAPLGRIGRPERQEVSSARTYVRLGLDGPGRMRLEGQAAPHDERKEGNPEMAFQQRDKLYGVGRGNRVMKAKRVVGPSANTVMNLRIAVTTCSVKGCNNEPLRTNPQAGAVERLCRDHIPAIGTTSAWTWDKGVDPLGRRSVFGNQGL